MQMQMKKCLILVMSFDCSTRQHAHSVAHSSVRAAEGVSAGHWQLGGSAVSAVQQFGGVATPAQLIDVCT